MNQRKQNRSRWYALALAAVLSAGCLMASVGTAYARYRLDWEKTIYFCNREPVTVTLGAVTEEIFDPEAQLAWVEQEISAAGEEDQTRKVMTLDFAVANYGTEGVYDDADIEFRLQLVGTSAAWNSAGDGSMILREELADGSSRDVTATVTAIAADTALYHSFGEGWIFRFLDENGRELTWTLEGGRPSCTELTILFETDGTDTSLLQLQVTGEYAD